AGMVYQVEQRGDRVPMPIPSGSLIEFLAVRLLLDRFAVAHVARESYGHEGPLMFLRDAMRLFVPPPPPPGVEQRAFPIFQLAQVLGWCPDELHRLDAAGWTTLLTEIESFAEIERRQTFHLAFERRFRKQALDALCLHRPRRPQGPPRFQVV